MIEVKNLHPLEIKLLRYAQMNKDINSSDLIKELNYNIGQCNQTFSWLSAKNFITEISRIIKISYELTESGLFQAEYGMPVLRLFNLLNEKNNLSLPEISDILNLDNSDVGSAYGTLAKYKIISMTSDHKAYIVNQNLPEEILNLQKLLVRAKEKSIIDDEDLDQKEKDLIKSIAKKRSAGNSPFKVIEREIITYRLTELGFKAKEEIIRQNITGEEIGVLTPELLSSGKWKNASFRAYGLNAPVSRLITGRPNSYADYIRWVKDKLVSLGFEEFDGPLVENEFWNGDALFMPQFHSARDIHDVYYVKEPSHCKEIEEPYLSNVARTHENGGETGSRGWNYSFDHEFTKRQVLRSQGTVLSAHKLTNAKSPGKYFGVVRCFRYDQVDAVHGADFYQTEGIVIGKDVNLKNLLGLLKMFAEEIAGAEEVKYVPGYFPFTEPSIEVHIKHPKLGWFELGGSGIFRPEVTKPLGIEDPVLAWGLGIDRMALMHLGLNDLRELFTNDIESVRTRRGNNAKN